MGAVLGAGGMVTDSGFSFKEDDSGIWSWGWRNMDGKNEFDSFENAAAEAWKEACFFAMEVIFPTMSLKNVLNNSVSRVLRD